MVRIRLRGQPLPPTGRAVVLLASVTLNVILLLAAAGLALGKRNDAETAHLSTDGPVDGAVRAAANNRTARFEYWLPSYVAAAKVRLVEHDLRVSASSPSPANVLETSVSMKLRYPFLSSEKLAQLQTILLEADRRRARALDGGPLSAIARLEQDIATDIERAVVALLNPAELLEYRMRDSGLAQQVLATGFIFSEEEFRAVFAKLVPLEAATASANGRGRLQFRGSVLQAIQEELSAARSEEFVNQQDPAHRALVQIAASMNLGADKIDMAYAAIKKSRAELQGTGLMLGRMDSRQAAEVARITAARDRVLREILGDAEAEKLRVLLNALDGRNSNSASA